MQHRDLPERWKNKIVEYLRARGVTDRDQLGALEFRPSSVVRLRFPDDSSAAFFHAFAIEASDSHEIGVFTEHCGYHIFPSVDTELSRD